MAYGATSLLVTLAAFFGYIFNPILFQILNPLQNMVITPIISGYGFELFQLAYIGWGIAFLLFGVAFFYWGKMPPKNDDAKRKMQASLIAGIIALILVIVIVYGVTAPPAQPSPTPSPFVDWQSWATPQPTPSPTYMTTTPAPNVRLTLSLRNSITWAGDENSGYVTSTVPNIDVIGHYLAQGNAVLKAPATHNTETIRYAKPVLVGPLDVGEHTFAVHIGESGTASFTFILTYSGLTYDFWATYYTSESNTASIYVAQVPT
jgi:hypothetical protein